jgi:hypothetical protein
MMIEQEKTRREELKLRHQKEEFVLEIQEAHALNEAKISELEAQATKLLAEAKGVGVEQQIAAINATVGAMRAHSQTLHERAEVMLKSLKTKEDERDNSGAIEHLVGRPGDQSPSPPWSGRWRNSRTAWAAGAFQHDIPLRRPTSSKRTNRGVSHWPGKSSSWNLTN